MTPMAARGVERVLLASADPFISALMLACTGSGGRYKSVAAGGRGDALAGNMTDLPTTSL